MPGHEQHPDAYLVGHLHERLTVDPRVGEQDLQVDVAGGRVFITGTVATPERRDAVTVVAREALPDREIHNEVTVLPVGSLGDPEALS